MKKLNYADVLEECASIAKERQAQYGEAGESLQLTCDIADVAFGIKLTKSQLAQVMVSLKLSREKFNHKADNLKDCINYLTMSAFYHDENN